MFKNNSKQVRRLISSFFLMILLLVSSVLTSCKPTISSNDTTITDTSITPTTRLVTDSVGREVAVPYNPKMICTLSSYAGPLVCMYGYANKMMATCNNVLRSNFLKIMCPALKNAINVKDGGTMNAESILALNCDLIFLDRSMYDNADEKQKLDVMGIPYIVVDFLGMQSQIEAAKVVGYALGCNEEADKFADYYQAAIDSVSTTIASIDNRTTYKLYHSVNEITRTDDATSLGAEWTGVTGVTNVSINSLLSIDGDKTNTSYEQIIEWNPDIIICNEAGVNDKILVDKRFEGVQAVIDNKVYQIPVGVTRYGHPNGFETPLAIYWLAKTIYPKAFSYEIEDKIKEFYKEFFEYDVSDEIVAAILEADSIRSPKQK